MNVDISMDRTWQNNFLNRIDEDGPWTNWDLYHLAYETEKSLLVPTFDGLQAPKHLSHFTPLPHQLEVAQNVIEQMNGKAILADEVGLGKTIEAGLIFKRIYGPRPCEKSTYTRSSLSRITMGIRIKYKVFHSSCSSKEKLLVGTSRCDCIIN